LRRGNRAARSSPRELGFSTFLAGIRRDEGVKVAIAPDGGIVIAGETDSPDFPTVRALQESRSGSNSAFVMKLDPSGREIVFSTYFGGSCCEFISDLALDSNGDIYFAGSTLSNEFPLVRELRSERQDVDGFLVKMSGDGQQILFSSLFGGAGLDSIDAIAVERPDQVFVVGTTSSSDLHGLIPPSINPWTSFLAKIDTEESRVVSVSNFGGSNFELPTDLAYDQARNSLWVAGMTRSNDFPTLRPLRPTSSTLFSEAGFIVRFSTLSEVPVKKSSSVLPGPVTALSLDRRGRAHVALHRLDRDLDGYQDIKAACEDRFPYLRLQPNGRGLQSWRCLAASPTAMATDRKRRIYIAASTFFQQPLIDPIQTTLAGGKDAYLMVLEPGAARLRFATLLGGRADDIPHGLAVSKRGKRIFLTGVTRSIDFPVASAVQPVKPGGNRVPGGFVTEVRP
jgi:hypothetical protein